jgi:hypothetical protein
MAAQHDARWLKSLRTDRAKGAGAEASGWRIPRAEATTDGGGACAAGLGGYLRSQT